jgi:hypothetical protein
MASSPNTSRSGGPSASTAAMMASATRRGSFGWLPASSSNQSSAAPTLSGVVLALRRGHARAAGEVGPQRARLDDRDVDAEMLDVLREPLGDAFDRELGARVGALPGNGGRDALERRDLDDVPGSLPAQERERGPDHVQGPEDVRVELGAQIVVGELLQGPEQAVARAVHDDVDASEARHARIHGRADGVRARDVERRRDGATGVARRQVRQRIFGSGRHDSSLTAREDFLGQRPSQTRRGTRDQPYA